MLINSEIDENKTPDDRRIRSECVTLALFFLVFQDVPLFLMHHIMFKGVDCANYFKLGLIFWSALLVTCIFLVIGIQLQEGQLLIPWMYIEPVSWVMKWIPMYYYYITLTEASLATGDEGVLALVVLTGFSLWGLLWVNIAICIRFHALVRLLYNKFIKRKIAMRKTCHILLM